MRKMIIGILLLSSAYALAMQQPTRVYDPEKTNELKTLLNGHSLSDPLPHAQIKKLVLEGANPNVKADESHYKGCSWFEALFLYSDVCDHFVCTVDFMASKGANPNLHPNGLLGNECFIGKIGRMSLLILYGADVHACNSRGESPLFCAVQGGTNEYLLQENRMAIINYLLKYGATSDIDVPTKNDETPLSFAKKHNLVTIVALLESYKNKKS